MKEKFIFFLGIIFIIFFVSVVIWFFKTLFATLSTLNPTVGTGLIAAASSIVISVISVLYAKRIEFNSVLMKEHREKKIPFYEDIVKFMLSFLYREKLGLMPLSEEEIIVKLASFTENLVIWGSDDVVDAWTQFRKVSLNNSDEPNTKIIFAVEDFLLAIRKDLGHKNNNLIRGKILSTFINDIDQHL